ncbi:OmpA family protein [Flaviramulus basaltis]|uniref:OmpA family protein n=1 Tax=Flaviramulus basaltis TaxID=369401 RepID=A0A1K2ICH0_9FLAO|nr:OmpA family protein [Flaviramulus basaltis]SFZ89411.1 OmpA family protein [Flaviramulus basaltis]
MKSRIILSIVIMFFLGGTNSQAQLLKKLKKRIEQKVENVIVEKTSDKAAEKTSNTLDTIFEGNVGNTKRDDKNKSSKQNDDQVNNNNNESDEYSETEEESSEISFGVYSNFTFVPGNKLLFYDDFTTDAVGDFPAHWETGGSGEVVTTSDSKSKWLSLVRRSGYMPTLENKLPENYTIEFDLANNGYGIGKPNSKLFFAFLSKKAYSMGAGGTLADVEILLSNTGFKVSNVENFGGEVEVKIGSRIDREMTDYLNNTVHISITINKKRLRMWVNQEKMVDSPNLLQANIGDYFIVQAMDVLPEKGHFVGISNFKIAEATEDLRSLLLKSGKFTTTGIYFDTAAYTVKKESYGILSEIAKMLKDNPGINLQIIGHTDSQGEDSYNEYLSRSRAQMVKQILFEEFEVEYNRLKFIGKGETEPIDDNDTEKGRANNRRVEFVKI